jgi:hypothetical protein
MQTLRNIIALLFSLAFIAFIAWIAFVALGFVFGLLLAFVRLIFGGSARTPSPITPSPMPRAPAPPQAQPRRVHRVGFPTAPARAVVPSQVTRAQIRVANRIRICATCKGELRVGEAVVKCLDNAGHAIHSGCRTVAAGACPHCGNLLSEQSVKFGSSQ